MQLPLLLLLFLSATCLTSCAGILDSEQPADRAYWLEPHILQGADSFGKSLPSITVSVEAAPGLNTDRMLLLQSGARLNSYQSARWVDNISVVLESVLIRTLESSGAYSRVAGSISTRSTDWRLELTVQNFFAVRAKSRGAIEVRVALGGYVFCQDLGHPIALHANTETVGNELARIVASYQSALNLVSSSLVIKLAKVCQKDV